MGSRYHRGRDKKRKGGKRSLPPFPFLVKIRPKEKEGKKEKKKRLFFFLSVALV